jgi:cellulose synthase/poly-beta-1,6-N-acetylglucosamine synthase-like glycosyltransferase
VGYEASIVIPARDESMTLPVTLPAVVAAARRSGRIGQIIVVVPAGAREMADPPFVHPDVEYVATREPGKFAALRTGVGCSHTEASIFIDADVLPSDRAFDALLDALRANSRTAAVSGRIVFRKNSAGTFTTALLHSWAVASSSAWHAVRTNSAAARWALPGALYALKNAYFPESPYSGLVDDASIGLWIARRGGEIGYAPQATVEVFAPLTYRAWAAQKLRSRRGWNQLRQVAAPEVDHVVRSLRRELKATGLSALSLAAMRAQDRLLCLAASGRPRPRAAVEEWNSARPAEVWQQLADGAAPAENAVDSAQIGCP